MRKRIGSKGIKPTAAASALLQKIREMVRTVRPKAFRAVNFAMVEACWSIGKRIVAEEQEGQARARYGEQLVT